MLFAGVLLFDNYYSDAKMRPYLTITSNLPINNNGEYFGDVKGLFTVDSFTCPSIII
jgi:hypothetical protein